MKLGGEVQRLGVDIGFRLQQMRGNVGLSFGVQGGAGATEVVSRELGCQAETSALVIRHWRDSGTRRISRVGRGSEKGRGTTPRMGGGVAVGRGVAPGRRGAWPQGAWRRGSAEPATYRVCAGSGAGGCALLQSTTRAARSHPTFPAWPWA